MKNTLLLTTLIFLVVPSAPAAPRENRITIIPLSPAYPTACCFDKKNYKMAPLHASQALSPADRDYFFSQSGLAQEVAGFDQLDRDLFYKRVLSRTPAALGAQYPKIATSKIKTLRTLLKRRGVTP